MLGAIKDIFLGLINLVTSLVGFVIDTIQNIAYIVTFCSSLLLKLPTLFSWLPSEALALIISVFGIVVIYKVMGREG